MMIEIAELFETPLIVDQMPDFTRVNAALRQSIVAQRAADPHGMAVSNRLGWHSKTDMLRWGGPAAMALVERCVRLADNYTVDIGAKEGPRYAWMPEMWANISKAGASNQFHCHPGAMWACVYYVDDGYDGSPDRKLGGELELQDPRDPMPLMEAPDLRFRAGPQAAIENPDIALRPASGRLLMFPAWLRHGVLPYLGNGERISIAINLTPMRIGEAESAD